MSYVFSYCFITGKEVLIIPELINIVIWVIPDFNCRMVSQRKFVIFVYRINDRWGTIIASSSSGDNSFMTITPFNLKKVLTFFNNICDFNVIVMPYFQLLLAKLSWNSILYTLQSIHNTYPFVTAMATWNRTKTNPNRCKGSN